MRVLRWLLVAVVVTALPVAAGVLVLEEEGEPPPPPAYESTPLSGYDTSTVAVARAPFCEAIPPEAVAEALAEEAGDAGDAGELTSYQNGDRAELAPGLEDVAHEYGCRVTGTGGTEARAWLFAPPVGPDRASDLVDDAAGRKACSRQPDAPAYGDPSVALICPSGKLRFASYRGLFGDAWLACTVAATKDVPEEELVDRAGRFCVAVAEAARAS